MSLYIVFSCFAIFVLAFPAKLYAQTAISINEFSPHPGSGGKEWVEFYNNGDVDMTGYWIDDDTNFSDDAGGSTKKSLAGVSEVADSLYVFELSSSMFNNSGDFVVLFDASGTIV